ncbi:MAG: carboxypeptidase M32 [Opitutales bacterium]
MTSTLSARERLVEKLRDLHSLSTIEGLLSWDEQVNLPPASADFRARQNAAMAGVVHRAATSEELGQALAEAEQEAGEPDSHDRETRTLLHFVRREYDFATKLPAEFVRRRAESQSKAFHAWRTARENDDFATFAPHLRSLIEQSIEVAAYCGVERARAYDFWLDRYDPGLDTAFVERTFAALAEELVPLATEIVDAAKPAANAPSIFRGFPVDAQETFLREVMQALGFDFQRGRLDRSVHPFCGGSPSDLRMTTRFDPDNPLDAIFSSIHETGHGLYEQGLPLEHLGTPLCEASGMAVHESQSRLWENQVCRGRPFWKLWEPRLRTAFATQLKDVTSEDLYKSINAVGLTPIRVDADEVTYNLHIILRFEIEKRLFSGELEVDQLPQVWNELSQTYILGLVPPSDREGCLQDVHWSYAAFGYFPSYTLGNLLAAQLWYAALEQVVGLEEGFTQGEYTPLLTWLQENIHRHGKQYDLRECAEIVTGKPLAHTSLIRYLKERYKPLYTHTQ